ncbi:OmpA family protein [Flavobacterium sp.]|uniref:OmpA family protein n=1 Tax=Flavobacterium sp. TaxID=239 RepID=UPI002B4B5C0B|nr:OmpA family protein [Flavobacterium sp.]HLF52110.1 OmpA family protein [Flavobacterium sp.]
MKNITVVLVFLISLSALAQDSFQNNENPTAFNDTKPGVIESNLNFILSNTGINTKLSEVGSAFFKNKYIMYSSRKTGEIGAGRDNATNEPYTNLYCLDIDKYGNLSKALFFSRLIRSNGNQGGLTFSPDENIIYYTKSEKENASNYQLYKSDFDPVCRCKWINEEPVAFNSVNYSIENPVVTSDGKKMYFSSNMPGGFGGYDIYVAEINEFGDPENPINLGKDINTSGNETHPYISRNLKTIYFSSNGHNGFGGQDVFFSKIKKNGFTVPLNLGKTINTAGDEIAFILASKSYGYVSSNRVNTVGSFDIYKFEFVEIDLKLSGIVHETISKIALPNAKITLLDDEGTVVDDQTVGENGIFNFDIEPSQKYTIVANKDGYEKFEKPIITSDKGDSRIDIALNQDKPLIVVTENKTIISIEKIYFDFDKSTLKKESTLSLNKIVKVLSENPAMKININAHTDNKGSDKYNLVLSEKRAQETKLYLIKNGIDGTRVNAKGLGETQSLSNCKENCTITELDADRRVEFIIQ